jgi:AbrB family looped-hinge helix DNA binding protein
MSKVTSKLQVTLPKALAERYGIRPGDEITFRESGDAIRVEVAGGVSTPRLSLEERLALFDDSTRRQRKRGARRQGRRPPKDRGWTREELYTRGLPR